MNPDFDVLIIGGGMVGATLACALGEAGMRVGVVEAHAPGLAWPAEGDVLRVSAITHASQRIFQSLQAWEQMQARCVSPFLEMRVWDAAGSGDIHFDSADIAEPYLGHIIENRVVQAALWERLQTLDAVELLCPATVDGFTRMADSTGVRLEDGRELSCRLLVGADGAASRVRALAGIAMRGWDYDQQGLVATVTTQYPHQQTAWQRFLPEGPLAFLPLADGRCSIVWSCTPATAERLLALDDAAFCRALGEAFEYRLGEIQAVGPRAAFPLRLRHAERYVAEGLALVGDAAHNIHPLAGQGVNLGLLDAAALAEVLIEARAHGRALGSLSVLRGYERWRKGHNMAMSLVMDGFKRLFGSRVPPLRWLRNLGMSVADRALPVKARLTRQAMGLEGDLPALARLHFETPAASRPRA